uniref:Uncharacterized protein n=1 Tax=Aegilops tauschii TaxID=37682 RepID=M8CQW4_AEGTA
MSIWSLGASSAPVSHHKQNKVDLSILPPGVLLDHFPRWPQERGSFLSAAREEFAIELPLQSLRGEEICFLSNGEFYGEDIFNFKDEIQEKNVVCEDLKASPDSLSSSSEHCFPVPGETFMPEMEEQEKSSNKVQSVSLPERKGFSSDAVEEKRLECDPVPVSAMEAKKPERVSKPHSSISQRIRQWESGNLKSVLDEIEDNPVEICFEKESFKGVQEAMPLETESCDQKQSQNQLAQEESDRKQLPEQELVDVKEELVHSKVAEKCIVDLQAEEIASIIGETEEDPPQEQRSEDVQAEEDAQPDGQDHQEDVQEEQEHEDADGEEGPLRSTSIARRVHTRTSSESLAGAGERSPSKGKEWTRTLACKLYEERIQLKEQRTRTARRGPLRSTSIARRVHTRTSSESLAGAGERSPVQGEGVDADAGVQAVRGADPAQGLPRPRRGRGVRGRHGHALGGVRDRGRQQRRRRRRRHQAPRRRRQQSSPSPPARAHPPHLRAFWLGTALLAALFSGSAAASSILGGVSTTGALGSCARRLR